MVLKNKLQRQLNTLNPQKEKCWHNGQIMVGRPNNLDPFNYSLHYGGPCIWEGIRSYKQQDGSTKIFKLKEHAERLEDSCKMVGILGTAKTQEIINGCEALVESLGGGDLYIRPVVYTHNSAEAAKPQDLEYSVTIFAVPLQPLHVEKDKGVHCGIAQEPRGYPQYKMQVKMASNYHSLSTAKPQKDHQNVDELLFKDNNGHITESTVANIWVYKGNNMFTPPNDGSILPGITRQTVYEILTDPAFLAKHTKFITCNEKKITKEELLTADAVFLCGTYTEIATVSKLDGADIGSQRGKELIKILKNEYKNLTRGIK